MSEKKSFVSLNAKYWKHSKAVGLFAHSERLFQKNKNVIDPELTKLNFGTKGLSKAYQSIHQQRQSIKKARNDANTLIEGILAFSNDRFQELEKKLSKQQLREEFDNQLQVLIKKIEKKYKLKFLAYQFHLDEFHVDRKGDKKINYHAHVFFYNYDFETNTSPLRAMKRKDWSTIQDLCGFSFSKWKFRRGISKEKTNREHLEKDDFIKQKHKAALDITLNISNTFKKLIKSVFTLNKNDYKQGIKKFRYYLQELKNIDERAFDEVSSLAEKIIPQTKTRSVKNGKQQYKPKLQSSDRKTT
tara:strand:- start:1079 stop:1981 length:903 start_codon:yes stop_codon:yes gene_type:complete